MIIFPWSTMTSVVRKYSSQIIYLKHGNAVFSLSMLELDISKYKFVTNVVFTFT